jgi:hypothetical protein
MPCLFKHLAYELGLFRGMAMKSAVITLSAICIATLQACSVMIPGTVNQGDTEADVIAKRGQPAHRYRQGSETLLEYPTGPFGQRTYMARLGPDGKVISFDQVLNTQTFSKIKVGEATKADVLRTIGAPSETSYLSLSDLEVWSYPYKESDVWNSMMHVHFDKSGIVRKMLNGPDPRYDPDRRFPFGFLR